MLLLEIAIITVAMFIPHGHLDPVVNIMIAFVCSLQVHSFRRVPRTRSGIDDVHRKSQKRYGSALLLY